VTVDVLSGSSSKVFRYC